MKKNTIFILFILIIFTGGFSYIGWNPTIGGRISQLVLYAIILFSFVNIKRFLNIKSNLKQYIMGFMLLPFLSIVPAALIHGQNIGESFYGTKFNLLYLEFFLLYIINIKETDILKIILYLGVGWCMIEIIQQFTYPQIWFATRIGENNSIEIRNGIYRFNIIGREFGLLMLFYAFVKYLQTHKTIYILGILIGLIGIYLLATRQIMVATAFSLLYGFCLSKKINLVSAIGIGFIILLIYLNADRLFGEYIEKTSEQLSDTNIRLLSYEYYGLSQNGGNLFQILLGNGCPGRNSQYAIEIKKLEEAYGLFRADIGIVGMYSQYGLFYIINILAFFIYCFKMRKYIDLYLKMFIIFMITTSIMLWHFSFSFERISIMCLILFLIDKSISQNKSVKNETKV